MFYRVVDWEVYSGPNPLRKIKFYKESRVKEMISEKQLSQILQAAKEISKDPKSHLQKAFYDISLLAVNTGMRKSEILNLEWKNLNSDEIIIKRKGGKVRSVPLNPTALKIITKQPKKDRFIFDIPNRAQPSLLVRTINQVKKKTGIKQFHFHLLRHYFTTSLVEKGADFITISKILGHSKLTTSFVYSHTNKERKRRAVDLLI